MRHIVHLLTSTIIVALVISLATCSDRPIETEDDRILATCEAFCSNEERCYPGITPGDYNNSRDEQECLVVCLEYDAWDGCAEAAHTSFSCISRLSCEEYDRRKDPDVAIGPCDAESRATTHCRLLKAIASESR